MAHISFIAATKLIELLKTASTSGAEHVRVIGANQLGLGADPFNPTSIIDFTEEAVRPISSQEDRTEKRAPGPPATPRASRKSGNYLLDIKGNTIECGSLKDLLAEGLRVLEKHQPGTLDKLSAIKPRTKRIVARDAQRLFDRSELAKKYAEKLIDGWWYGTNNSADETNVWLRRAADLAGLEWGRNFTTSL
ncbi:MAG TPA: hypothetical protein VKZ79_03060 [Alphaproteobacteria bacterium]|nr:hypothetical protein [Alphaproteobacteria bacterium]